MMEDTLINRIIMALVAYGPLFALVEFCNPVSIFRKQARR